MIETTIGLPNTCSNCGKEPGYTWFAEHEDAARSGQGFCSDCASIEAAPAASQSTPPPTPHRETTSDDLTQLAGVGKARQAELNDAGIFTFKQLAQAKQEDLVTKMEVNPDVIAAWQQEAEKLA